MSNKLTKGVGPPLEEVIQIEPRLDFYRAVWNDLYYKCAVNIHLGIQDGLDYMIQRENWMQTTNRLFLRREQLGIILVGTTNLDISTWMGWCRQLGEFCEERAKEREEEF